MAHRKLKKTLSITLWQPPLKSLHNGNTNCFSCFYARASKKPRLTIPFTKALCFCQIPPLLPGATALCWKIRSPSHHLRRGEKGTPCCKCHLSHWSPQTPSKNPEAWPGQWSWGDLTQSSTLGAYPVCPSTIQQPEVYLSGLLLSGYYPLRSTFLNPGCHSLWHRLWSSLYDMDLLVFVSLRPELLLFLLSCTNINCIDGISEGVPPHPLSSVLITWGHRNLNTH